MNTQATPARRIADAAEDYWKLLLDFDPELRTRAGLPVERLPTRSHTEVARRATDTRGIVSRLADLDPDLLSGSDADTLRILRFLADAGDGEARHFWPTPSATPYQILGLSRYHSTVFLPHRFSTAADVDRYLDLVYQYARCFDALAATVREQAHRGVVIASPALQAADATFRGLRRTAEETLRVDGARLTALGAAESGRLTDGIAKALGTEVLPSIERMLATLGSTDYKAAAPARVGLGAYPGGEAAYRFMVWRDTSLDTTPEQLHRLGLEECQRLGERIRDVREVLGFSGEETSFKNFLKTRGDLYATTPDEVEERYLNCMARLEPRIGDYFGVLPKAPYGVARLAENLEAGLTYGYYERPTEDMPVGRYRYNGSGLADRPLVTAAALIYHELAPGHHFHLARQSENGSLADFRRHTMHFGAFIEGWAEYASDLGWEMGLYADPWDAYGRLSQERFTAARLAVDTALNCGWWTPDQALDFMRRNTHESDAQLRSELLRYATDVPAQALGYRAGSLTIARLRRSSEERLGRRFRIRDFHEIVLDGGAMPLTALEARVTRELPASER
ncbi:DUF885 domain-containing protein [Streptomyces oryzae]|uniref:DUF885 domain-containing protein n=1 Tax=Streptomyces oryzae TaxID=1434886 RepID=A0ABS3XAZ1_9ACTN|nr:DUF885 domain-containing protein [Streptomyces oryzae]MBO8192459.1 DUF885 domain-containing protein [Streptomyces oryzae]